MKNRLVPALVMAAVGIALLAAAAFADPAAGGSAPQAADQADRRGGTLRLDSNSDFDYVDTSLAYFSHSWQLLNTTQLKLMGFPQKEGAAGSRMRPEAAAGFPKVSRDGKTYTFTIKRGFKFSDGSAVNAHNFAHAFRRALSPKMQSPASSFLDDMASYKVVRNFTLVIRLKKVAPDFLARMTMPFFAAIPTNRPIVPEGVGAPLVSAGPYYLKEWNKKQSALVVRNPHWNNNRQPWRGLGFPNHVDQMTYTIGITPANQRLRVEANQTDLGGFPPAQAKELADKYGLNKGRFFIRKNLVLWYLNLNNEQTLFRNNAALRRAVNHAVDRRYLTAQHGYLGGGRTDQVLPPGMPGFRNWDIYSLKGPNYNRARQLARGNTRSGKAVFYAFNVTIGPPVAQSVQFNLRQIGIDVEIKMFDRVVQNEKMSVRGEPFDIGHEGWVADYPDPYNFINVLLDGRRIQAEHNNNTSYFNERRWNNRMERASRLSGQARLRAYGLLDRDMMRDAAPMVPYLNSNARIFVSEDVGCFTYNSVYSATNLLAICKKR